MISVREALDVILRDVRRVGHEQIALPRARGRVLAEPVQASRDVPPFAIIDWQHTVRGVNVVGLKRAGFDEKRIRAIRETFRILFRKGRNLALAVKEVEEGGTANTDVLAVLEFIKSSKRGVCFGAD